MRRPVPKSKSAPAVKVQRVVVLRWRRIGNSRRTACSGRFVAYRSGPSHWALYDNGIFADGATWTQITETARRRIEKEAQHNADFRDPAK